MTIYANQPIVDALLAFILKKVIYNNSKMLIWVLPVKNNIFNQGVMEVAEIGISHLLPYFYEL